MGPNDIYCHLGLKLSLFHLHFFFFWVWLTYVFIDLGNLTVTMTLVQQQQQQQQRGDGRDENVIVNGEREGWWQGTDSSYVRWGWRGNERDGTTSFGTQVKFIPSSFLFFWVWLTYVFIDLGNPTVTMTLLQRQQWQQWQGDGRDENVIVNREREGWWQGTDSGYVQWGQ